MRRWAIFNAVGVLGAIVQLAVLHTLTSGGVHYLVATLLAVEAAILHNFAWHERWTWADRGARCDRVLSRLAGFHAANGIVSLAGSFVLMRILVGSAGIPVLPANVLSILACSVINFVAADRLVFVTRGNFGEHTI
jgi:dolichol-phosphate mannosyltransferase